MSGIISGDERDDLFQRYTQRFNELTQRNPNQSLGPSVVGGSNKSTVNGQYFNSKGQIANRTLSTQQFYKKNYNHDHQVQAENILPNQQLIENSSTYTGVSDASLFKKPLPVKRLNNMAHIERRFDLLVEALRSIEDKPTFKFMMTMNETFLHTVKKLSSQPVNPAQFMDVISNLVKEEYFSKRVPKSICGSAVTSDQASTIDQYSGCSERSIQVDKPSRIAPNSVSDPRVVLQDITQQSFMCGAQSNKLAQDFPNSVYSSISRMGLLSDHQQDMSIRSKAVHKRGIKTSSARQFQEGLTEGTLTGSTFNLFNDSEIAQRRDEAAASQEKSISQKSLAIVLPKKSVKTLPKSTPKPTINSRKVSKMTKTSSAAKKTPSNEYSKLSAPVSQDCTFDQSNKNISILNGTSNGISLRGRPRKPPVKYWNSKGDELSLGDIDESVFNESITLRNKKVLDKKKTPPVRGKKANTPPLPEIPENEVPKLKSAATKKPRGRPPAGKETPVAKTGKDTPIAKAKKENPVAKTSSSRGKPNKKKETNNQNTEKTVKKSAPKRKSKESSDTISKKKKIEDHITSDIEEDIFGAVNYKKPAHQNLKLALSPSAALLSAKKAAGEAQSKATPPCKAICDMMANESIQSAMSAAKEVPKQNDAIKRSIKRIEKDMMKPPSQPKAKPKGKNTTKEDYQLNDLMKAVKSSFTVENSACSASLTVFRGYEQESDQSDMEQDDVDDDLM